MKALLILCLLFQTDYSPRDLKWCRNELKRIGVQVTTQNACQDKFTTLVSLGLDRPYYGSGMASVGSYGNNIGFASVYKYIPFVDADGQLVLITKRQEKRRLNAILCHELGHNLGMVHNQRRRSLMYYAYYPLESGRRARFLTQDIKQINNGSN